MSKRKGYIKWYRDAADNPLFCKKPFDDWHAFEYLCFKARKEPTDLVLNTGEVIHIGEGQIFISREKLADIFGWTAKKLRAWELRTKRLNMVTAKGMPRGTLYTLENYEFHQGEGQAKGQAKGQPQGIPQGPRKKNDKECKKKDVRAREDETPRDVIPMPDDVRKKIKEVL